MPMSPRLLRPLARYQSPSQFSPADIPDLAVWLDASDESTITLNSGGVSQWNSKGPGGVSFTQETASQQPTLIVNALNALPVVSFDGADDAMSGPEIFTSLPVTVFAVGRVTGQREIGMLLAHGGDKVSCYHHGTGGNVLRLYNGFDLQTAGPLDVNTWASVTFVAESDPVSKIFIGAGLEADGNSGNQTPAGPAELGWWSGGTQHSFWEIAELAAYSRAITLAERESLIAYASNKWGV